MKGINKKKKNISKNERADINFSVGRIAWFLR